MLIRARRALVRGFTRAFDAAVLSARYFAAGMLVTHAD